MYDTLDIFKYQWINFTGELVHGLKICIIFLSQLINTEITRQSRNRGLVGENSHSPIRLTDVEALNETGVVECQNF